MHKILSYQFSIISCKLNNLLDDEDYKKAEINSLIDELNTKLFEAEFFVQKCDVTSLVKRLYRRIKPEDEFLAAKASHLINSILKKQDFKLEEEHSCEVLSWHIQCLRKCSDVILPDILHNMQCILQSYPSAGYNFAKVLVGKEGLLVNLIDIDKNQMLSTQNPLQICLVALKVVIYFVSLDENKSEQTLPLDVKEHISEIVTKFLMKGFTKSQDEFLYCKATISALRILSQLYFNDQTLNIPLPEVMGICRHFVCYGLVQQPFKPEKIMPAQQTVADVPVAVMRNTKGGKKQKLRKQRNNAIESLKKEIPVSDSSLMKDVDHFENNSAYKPATLNDLETQKAKTWALTSDSDMSDVESGREAKLIALKSRVRQSAANLLLVLLKVREKREIFGYWWALLPDTPDSNNWTSEEGSKKMLAFCAVTDPVANTRATMLSVILTLLSGSRMYLWQAETSQKENPSFIPFSVTLGYIIACMHKVLVDILDNERSHAVIIAALKCCAALVQATPYHKMREGLISELVMSMRKFLVHRDVTLQVGALITMGCVLSVDPQVDEILKAIEKDTGPSKNSPKNTNATVESEELDDFEEGYFDDEMFIAIENLSVSNSSETVGKKDIPSYNFRSWILDICFKNLGWTFRGEEIRKTTPSAIPIIMESLQVISAIAFHHLPEVLQPHLTLLADILSEMLQDEHQDVVLQAAKCISVIGDAIQKLGQTDSSPPLAHCVYFWQKLVPPLSAVLQTQDSASTKAIVFDCIANIGEKSCKELPRHLQVLCCTLLLGSCSDKEPAVRAAAVRALAMAVMFKTLREDICFVSDCAENILRAIVDPTPVVQTKGAWALGNLSDALVLNMEDPDCDQIDDGLLLQLFECSIRCAWLKDKIIKMSATRSLGNLLRLIKEAKLRKNPKLKSLCLDALDELLKCATKEANMKVRWNACHALGNAMQNDTLFTCIGGWLELVLDGLCQLAQYCKNLKVRINAASALRAPSTREQYGYRFVQVWQGVMAAMDNALNVDDFTEYRHKDNLIEQLCVTLAHICCLLQPSDLSDILDPLTFHFDSAKSLFTQLYHKLPPENVSCMKILQAAKYVTVDLTASGDKQTQALGLLQEIFIWDI